jgi:phosphoheptose isomerase
MKDVIRAQFAESIAVKQEAVALTDAIAESAAILIGALRHGHKVLVCGNGGSAADAQHLAAELMGRFETERVGLPCVALTTDTSMLTAWSNDYGFETVFARQVRALGNEGDVLIGLSTSGNSPSILRAMEAAADRGLARISLTGRGGGALAAMKGICHLVVPSPHTSRIQEVHITIIHIWAKLIDEVWRQRA